MDPSEDIHASAFPFRAQVAQCEPTQRMAQGELARKQGPGRDS